MSSQPGRGVVGPVQIGEYQVWSLSAGSFRLDGGTIFGVVPKSLWQKLVAPDERNLIHQALNCLLVRGRGKTWLIESGIGTKLPEKFRNIYAQESADELDRSLEAAGVARGDVDGVVLTHLHQDHAGGATRREGEEIVTSFPNARIYVQGAEWDDAVGCDAQTALGYRVDENIEPLEKAGVVELLDGDSELAPGLRTEVSPGHTRGHQSILIEGEGKTLCFIGDLVPSHYHLKPIYIMAYDIFPRETYLNKLSFLNRAVEEDWLVAFTHDAAPWGRIRKGDNGELTFDLEDVSCRSL